MERLKENSPVKAIYSTQHFSSINELNLDIVERPKPKIGPGECLIQVHHSVYNFMSFSLILYKSQKNNHHLIEN